MPNNIPDKRVMLFSGGMDSYCLRHIYRPDVLLFFKLGTVDNERELQNLLEMPFVNDIEIIDLPLVDFEMENKIIPHRNSIMALIASNYGNQIYLGATAGDTTKDKDYVFKSQIEGMLNYFSLDTHKTPIKAYPFTLNMPFKELSKAEILGRFIKEKGDLNDLTKYSRSCYEGTKYECGKCRACIRKAVALTLHGVRVETLFEVNPFSSITDEAVNKLRERGQEYLDFIKAKDIVKGTRMKND